MQDLVIFSKALHYVLLCSSHSLSPVQISPLSYFLSKSSEGLLFFRESFQLSQPHVRTVQVKALIICILTNLHVDRLLIPGIKYYGHI